MKMKTILYQILTILFLFSLAAKGQKLYPAENAFLWTDRAIYVSGEIIQFGGQVNLEATNEEWSQVVYVELITPTGQKINQSKWELKKHIFTGLITIPEDVLSGYYFLRAYTKYMRNGSPENYAYVRLKLVNPRTDELLPLTDSLIDQSSNTNYIQAESIHIEKDNYHSGETINLSKEEISNFTNASLSIIPSISQAQIPIPTKSKLAGYFNLEFYPETRGPSISGLVSDKISHKPLPFHLVNIHILGEKDFIGVLSDTSGRFHLALPERKGIRELFLIGASKDDTRVEIQIDHDYCNHEILLKVPAFSIDDSEKESILQMAQNQQLLEAFMQNDSLISIPRKYQAFYGEAFKIIDFDFYVPLDSLEQYFTDIPSWVMVKKKRGKRKLSLVGTQGELKFYEPLVMVDWVPVDDIDRIMEIDPTRVKQIDILNQSYWHGDILYGGIVNVLTRKTDFGGNHFPESGMYLNYTFYSISDTISSSDLPFKNTFSWIPNLQNFTNEDLLLKAPQFPGKYFLNIQGVNSHGDAILKGVEFEVKK